MAGVLTDLSAIGAQDSYLVVDPEVTYFKSLYRRHTNFSIEPVALSFSSTSGFNKTNLTATVSRNGDLVRNIWVRIDLGTLTDSGSYYTDGVGHALLSKVELEIGGHVIDTTYGDFMELWSEISQDSCHATGDGELVGKFGNVRALKLFSQTGRTSDDDTTVQKLFVPLNFWFRASALALPLIAMQYHEVRVRVTTRAVGDLVLGDVADNTAREAGASCSFDLLCEFVYLDEAERVAFASSRHEYLITQCQHTGVDAISNSATTISQTLTFNHPTTLILFHFLSDEAEKAKEWHNWSYQGAGIIREPVQTARLQFNGHDRTTDLTGAYWRAVTASTVMDRVPNKHVYTMPFCLKGSSAEWRPSGSVNLSRIDTVTLKVTLRQAFGEVNAIAETQYAGSSTARATSTGGANLYTYAVSRNILTVHNGMAGSRYAN